MQISLFPGVDSPFDAEGMEKDRLEWLEAAYGGPPTLVREAWNDPEFYDAEREIHANKNGREFQKVSSTLGIVMLRKEVADIPYLRRLRDGLRLRVNREDQVAFVGPTMGAELQAIHNAGGYPILVSDGGGWFNLLEERMIDDRIPFDSCSYEDLLQHKVNPKYIVVSGWLAKDWKQEIVRTIYGSLGQYGFVLAPAGHHLADLFRCTEMIRRDAYQDSLLVFFKSPNLPETLSRCPDPLFMELP